MVVTHWVRHGETEWNRARRIQGQTDSPLSELGQAQAAATAGVLRDRPAVALYTSDLGRAKATAQVLGTALGQRPQLDARLRELDYGELEGMTWSEVQQTHTTLYQALRRGSTDVRPPGGESRRDMLERAQAFMAEVRRLHQEDEVVVVSHGGVLAHLFRTVLGIPHHVRAGFRIPNCGISTFVHDGFEWNLRTWSRVDHLDSLAGG